MIIMRTESPESPAVLDSNSIYVLKSVGPRTKTDARYQSREFINSPWLPRDDTFPDGVVIVDVLVCDRRVEVEVSMIYGNCMTSERRMRWLIRSWFWKSSIAFVRGMNFSQFNIHILASTFVDSMHIHVPAATFSLSSSTWEFHCRVTHFSYHFCLKFVYSDSADSSLLEIAMNSVRWNSCLDLLNLPDQSRSDRSELGLMVNPVDSRNPGGSFDFCRMSFFYWLLFNENLIRKFKPIYDKSTDSTILKVVVTRSHK